MFADREEAGTLLGEKVAALGLGRPLVLGIPRGGVVVAARVAQALGAPLDVIVPRKIGAPRNPELAIGAVGPDGQVIIDEGLAALVGASPTYIARESQRQSEEVKRRLDLYRRGLPPVRLAGEDVVVVDDGVATGHTVLAALRALRTQNPGSLTLAVPVAPPEVIPRLRAEADRLVCLLTPSPFYAVGQFYHYFPQVSDEEVAALLEVHRSPRPEPE
ncbi:MAG: phosphoribosyltransferase family protein [Bacillota bacterium]|nr:phosphoribosyltransferase family protein [Bacillota bacterium]MDI7248961.1 phosphoribosyltransferase family protein [Bacillota bacterium]